MSATELADETCFIERSKVRELLIAAADQEFKYRIAGKLLRDVDDLKIHTAESLRAIPSQQGDDGDVVGDALLDALGGWQYIRRNHGDLYGVGWDRVEEKLNRALHVHHQPPAPEGEGGARPDYAKTPDEARAAMEKCDYWNGRKSLSEPDGPSVETGPVTENDYANYVDAENKAPNLCTDPAASGGVEFQPRVLPWMLECFGPSIPFDKTERNHRFLEEALELVQACGCTQDEAHQLVDYVYGRDQGDINQEVGGVMVTLAALCIANGFDMHSAGETELDRIWTKVEQIRAKQAAKPKHSPLPATPVPQPGPEVVELRAKVVEALRLIDDHVADLRKTNTFYASADYDMHHDIERNSREINWLNIILKAPLARTANAPRAE